MKVVLSTRARNDLRDIHAYIAADDPAAADRVIEALLAAIGRLSDRPHARPRWKGGDTRYLSVPRYRYRIHYEVDDAARTVNVLPVWHPSRLPPEFP